MAAQITLLVGPARSGKTTRLVEAYRHALAGGGIGSCLWLGPNRHAVTGVREQLLDTGLTHCGNPHCMTFGQFTQQVLDASTAPLRPLTETMKQQLLKELLDRGVAEGTITHFRPIATTPGLLKLIAGTIREWKRLEIWPMELARACSKVGMSQKDRELLWLYEEYQRVLTQYDLYDAEGRAWTARERLRAGQQKPIERVRHVFVDGFTDFTRTEHEILEVLIARAETVSISLPLDCMAVATSSGSKNRVAFREDLFAKPQATFTRLKRQHEDVRVEEMPRRSTSWEAMDHLEANLFQSPADIATAKDSLGIEIVSAAGQLNEIEGIARHIKRMLQEGDTGKTGSRVQRATAEQILVVFRSLQEISPLVEEVFDRFQIPYAVSASKTLGQSSGVAALVAWLRLAANDWEFRPLISMLTHNSFAPEWNEWRAGRAAVSAEHTVRRLQLPSGKNELLQRLTRYVERAKTEAAAGAEKTASQIHAERALPLLAKLGSVFDDLPATGTATQWARALSNFANQIGLSKLILSDAAEDEAWKQMMRSLRSLDRMAKWRRRQETPLKLSDVLEFIVELAGNETLPSRQDAVGRVKVVSAVEARSLNADYVFVAGLTEKSFPAAEREDNLYSDTEIGRLIGEGLPLRTRVDHSHAEMLLFYEVLTRAGKRLYLSYPGLDAKAQPLTPSPFLAELERAFGETPLVRRIDQELSPVPRESDVQSSRDFRLRAVYEAVNGKSDLLASYVQSFAVAKDKEAASSSPRSLLSALKTIHARSRGEGFGIYEGVFDSQNPQASLAERFGPSRCWSPSQLEMYAYCPFRFFAERVLKLEPLTDLAFQIDHALRGDLLHGTLATYHRELNAKLQRPSSPAMQSAQEFEQAAAQVLADLLEKVASDEPVQQSLREVDRRLLGQWLANYYLQHQKYDELWAESDEPLRPAHFEVSFGPVTEFLDEEVSVQVAGDTLATTAPLELHHNGESLFFRGRVDRVDLGRIAGQEVFNVVDYKSGSKYRLTAETIAAGETLQLPLYALALEQLLLADRGTVAWQASYWQIKEKGFNHRGALKFRQCVEGTVEVDPQWKELQAVLLDRIFALVRGIRQGQFPMHCADEHCTGRCDFRTVCRVAQVRSLEKTWQPPGTNS